jgi:hypothetical protein
MPPQRLWPLRGSRLTNFATHKRACPKPCRTRARRERSKAVPLLAICLLGQILKKSATD